MFRNSPYHYMKRWELLVSVPLFAVVWLIAIKIIYTFVAGAIEAIRISNISPIVDQMVSLGIYTTVAAVLLTIYMQFLKKGINRMPRKGMEINYPVQEAEGDINTLEKLV